MQARRQLRAGQALKTADLAKPDLVQRDQNVTLIYEAAGLYLTIRGKALDGGTEGDVVNVLNLQSKRTVSGVVIGRGQVAISVATPRPPAAAMHLLARSQRQPRPSPSPPTTFASRSKSRVMFMFSRHSINRIVLTGALLALAGVASGCSSIDRLSQIGEQPKLTAIENPTAQPGYKPVQMPMPKPETASYNANSLWRNGSRAFFKDQRAAPGRRHPHGDRQHHRQGQHRQRDPAQPHHQGRLRASPISSAAKTLDRRRSKVLPGRILTADSTASSDGKGSVNRQEALQTNVAAVVTQVLPNGNLVVEGKQEIRVNFEIRELIVAGIVRPEDIQSDNTIDSSKIAQARIAYGGRGQITDVQQPRYGQQVMDVLLPF